MDAYQDMRKFIQAASEYSRHHADSSASDVQKHLQIIATATNVDLFDPGSAVATQFYVCLHELMSSVDSRSMLVSSAISALQKACSNKKAKEALIHTYKFIPVLTRFLSTNHISDKQARLLHVLSEVTYGVKITWQEAHLPHLVSTLVQIISGNNQEHKAQALTVLVNLCYRNLPVLYVLMRKTEIKKFIKCITTMNGDPAVCMQVCKMLIIIGEMKGQLPDRDILNFVDVSFNCVTDAFQRRDASTLRQMVDFFKDMNENPQIYLVISRYTKCCEDVKRILDLTEATGGPDEGLEDCMAILLDFIPTAFKIKLSKTAKLIPRLMTCTMPWINHSKTCLPTLNVLLSVTEFLSCQEFRDLESMIVPSLAESLSVLISLLQPEEDGMVSNDERQERLIGTATLLAEMSASSSDLRNRILNTVNCDLVKSIFEALYQENYFQNSVSKNGANKLSIELVYLAAVLSTFSQEWMALHVELLSKKEVLSSMAVSILNGEKSLKYRVLFLVGTSGWSKEALTSLCEIMSEMRADSLVPDTSAVKQPTVNMADCMPLYASESRINEVLESLQGVSVAESSTSAVMELYEYKLAAMGHAERRVQAALEAADARCIGLNHQVAQLRGEMGRLHQLLFYNQQTIEGVTAEKKDLMHQLEKITTQNSLEKTMQSQKLKELTKYMQELEHSMKKQNAELEVKNSQLKEKQTQVEEFTVALLEKTDEFEKLKGVWGETVKKYEELKKSSSVAEEGLQKARADILEKEAQIEDFKAENEELRSSLSQCMEKNSQKDEQLSECQKKIQYLEQIREAVISVAGRKEKF